MKVYEGNLTATVTVKAKPWPAGHVARISSYRTNHSAANTTVVVDHSTN